jgi:hypothetical protein
VWARILSRRFDHGRERGDRTLMMGELGDGATMMMMMER